MLALSDKVFSWVLRALPLAGRLAIIDPNGRRIVAGQGGGPSATLRLRDPSAPRSLLLDPELRFGELYVDGGIVLEEGTLLSLIHI